MGILLGAAGGVVMIVRKFAIPSGREEDGEHRR
jgi:hypothetical protein